MKWGVHKMGETVNGMRLFKCKSCGQNVSENIYKWRKKPQNVKNVCMKCIEQKRLRAQTARERAEDMGYGGISMSGFKLF